MSDKARKEAKRQAVVAKLKEIGPALDVLSGLWDDKTLDALVLALGIGRVELAE